MSDEIFRIPVPSDEEGYIPLECPNCDARFKVIGPEYAEWVGDSVCCALCGLSASRGQFVPEEVVDAALVTAKNHMADVLNKAFGQMARNAKGPHVRVTHKAIPKESVPALRAITDLAVVALPCCETSVKVPFGAAASVFYCPYCGQVQN